jgi:hypothetical protein
MDISNVIFFFFLNSLTIFFYSTLKSNFVGFHQPGKKKVRGLERQFHEKCPHFPLFLIRNWINENKTGKDNVCKGKLSFLGDIAN